MYFSFSFLRAKKKEKYQKKKGRRHCFLRLHCVQPFSSVQLIQSWSPTPSLIIYPRRISFPSLLLLCNTFGLTNFSSKYIYPYATFYTKCYIFLLFNYLLILINICKLNKHGCLPWNFVYNTINLVTLVDRLRPSQLVK